MNITKLWLRCNLKKTLVAFLVLGITSYVLTIFYPNLTIDDSTKVSEGWPTLVKEILGDPLYAFSSIGGWLHIQFFHIIYWVIGGIYVTLLTALFLAGEVESHRIEIILSCPISRIELMTGQISALILYIPLLLTAAFIGCWFAVLGLDVDYNVKDIFLAAFGALPLLIAMSSITLFFSVLSFDHIKALITSWTIFGISFAMEELIPVLLPKFHGLVKLSIFHYYDSADILIRHIFQWSNFFILMIFGLTMIAVSMIVFKLRDIP